MRIVAASFVFGFVVVGLLLLCFAFGLAIIADIRGWESFSIGSGLLTIFSYERTSEERRRSSAPERSRSRCWRVS